ncbi:leucine-rich repeat domain-containing protein [Persicirhabdus sediminis]|uniref:Leucine-rich repeat protein n=1 Tax=Persicirhabdus sediminis TaxID=454144 RepID=A0A8J7SM49_9BACT|nr:leucine-rich repeat domain-containing protein [Persicirhabdus sediminis]MBK1790863.1 leucine-rich repeat protein [Persicirhabdus sediminis]
MAALQPSLAADIDDLQWSIQDDETIIIERCNDKASGELIIPEKIEGHLVKVIQQHAFDGCDLLTKIELPDSVIEIGASAFCECRSLVSIQLSSNLQSIGSDAFVACVSLNEVVIPASVGHIGQRAFVACESLTDIYFEGDAPSINSYIFEDIIEGEVEYWVTVHCRDTASGFYHEHWGGGIVLSSPFLYGIEALSYFELDGAIHIESCDTSFSGAMNIPDYIDQLPVLVIEDGAFKNCSSITSVELPAYLTDIGEEAFSDCTQMKSIEFQLKVRNIGPDAFASCEVLESVTLPSQIARIDSGTFSCCYKLQSINIPSGVDSIGDAAFLDCISLVEISIPSSVKSIGQRAFYYCEKMETISLSEGIESIGAYAFINCSSLGKVRLPGSVEALATSTFAGCSSLQELILSEGLLTIGSNIIASCTSLRMLDLPASVERIDEGAFTHSSLGAINVTTGNVSYSSVDGVLFDAAQKHLIFYPVDKKLSVYHLPDSVESIAEQAFWGCTYIESMVIPTSVNNLSVSAVSWCLALRAVYFLGDAPAGSEAFNNLPNEFIIYYFSDRTGFTSPNWMGVKSEEIDRSIYPEAEWLISQNRDHDVDVFADDSGDGVSLFMAKALGLDPDDHLASQMPQADLQQETVEITFKAEELGVDYFVEQSHNLIDWDSQGVSLTPINADGEITASVPATETKVFLRLVVARAGLE